jgi:hypothetical protein
MHKAAVLVQQLLLVPVLSNMRLTVIATRGHLSLTHCHMTQVMAVTVTVTCDCCCDCDCDSTTSSSTSTSTVLVVVLGAPSTCNLYGTTGSSVSV